MSVLAAILAAWVLAGGMFLGIGLLLSQLESFKPKLASDYFDTFWLGFAASVALLQLWHLVFPVNAWLALALGVLGAVGLLATRRAWSTVVYVPRQQVLWVAAACALGAVWLGLMGLRPLEIYDAGLYHLQAIEWNSTYPTVPGLGNLHGRLAFNSSFFLLLALFGQGPLAGQAYRATVGLLVLAFFAQTAVSIVRVVRTDHATPADWLLALMALPAVAVVGANGLATTSTDLPIFPLQVLIAYQLLRWLARPKASDSRWHLGQAVILGAVTATIKLSSAGFVAGCLALIVFVALTDRHARQTLRRASPLAAVGLAAVLFAGLVANGIILSGYPAYPSTILPFPVEWRVPAALAIRDSAGIVLFARQPGPLAATVQSGWAWLPGWIGVNAADLAPPAIGALVAVCLTISQWTRTSPATRRAVLLVAAVWVGLAVWFLAAPAYRFGGALFWLAGAVPLAALRRCHRSRLIDLAVGAFVLASLVPPQTEELSLIVREPIAALRRPITPVPVTAMSVYTTGSGLQLNVPADSELAWAAPLPSTPVPDPRLRLRCPDTLACGFVLDGLSGG